MQRPRTRIARLPGSRSLQLRKLEITAAATEGKLEIDPRLVGLPDEGHLFRKPFISTFSSLQPSVWELLLFRDRGAGKHIPQEAKTAPVMPDM